MDRPLPKDSAGWCNLFPPVARRWYNHPPIAWGGTTNFNGTGGAAIAPEDWSGPTTNFFIFLFLLSSLSSIELVHFEKVLHSTMFFDELLMSFPASMQSDIHIYVMCQACISIDT